jgi:ubiquinone/menaquinone biosynthesis C-methylase UbiE
VGKSISERNVERIIITDIVPNELCQVKGKLTGLTEHIDFMEDNAVDMKQKDGSADINVLFFLLHELPCHLQRVALEEAGRVLASGGKLVLAEFHRPDAFIMRILSRIYFFVFEPHAFALCGDQDPVQCLEKTGVWTCERKTYFFGNYQVIIATKG